MNQFIPLGQAHLTHASREDLLRIPLVKELQLAESRKAFSTVALAPWNILPSNMRSTFTLLFFCKNLEDLALPIGLGIQWKRTHTGGGYQIISKPHLSPASPPIHLLFSYCSIMLQYTT